MTTPRRIEVVALSGMPLVQPGDDLVALLAAALERDGLMLQDGDVIVLAQKIVSKAEGRLVALSDVDPSSEARRLARLLDKDPRLVEVILSDSRRVVRAERNILITEHRLGLVMANAGVDQSNVGPESEGQALLLPADPDASAARIRKGLERRFGTSIGVVINDSFGRPWRNGTVGVAIGASGLPSLSDKRGDPDLFGRELKVTVVATADEIAAAASLLMGQADEGLPAVLLRGLRLPGPELAAAAVVRPCEQDLFR